MSFRYGYLAVYDILLAMQYDTKEAPGYDGFHTVLANGTAGEHTVRVQGRSLQTIRYG